MKTLMTAVLATAMLVSVPAMATESQFTGLRAEATVGVDDVVNGLDTTKVSYGAGVGFDAQLYPRVIVGASANLDNVFDRRQFGVATRLGYEVRDNVLVYGTVGYANWKQTDTVQLDGLRVGGGIEAVVTGPVFLKAEYRYSDFSRGVGQHGVVAGLGVRF